MARPLVSADPPKPRVRRNNGLVCLVAQYFAPGTFNPRTFNSFPIAGVRPACKNVEYFEAALLVSFTDDALTCLPCIAGVCEEAPF